MLDKIVCFWLNREQDRHMEKISYQQLNKITLAVENYGHFIVSGRSDTNTFLFSRGSFNT